MKKTKTQKWQGAAIAALLLAGAGPSFAADVLITNIFNTFDSAASGTGVEWGTGAVAWDGAQGNPAGALLMTLNFTGGSDTPAVDYMCMAGGNPWYQPQTVKASLYKTLEFDIKYDPTSEITLAEFNDLSSWPTTLTNGAGDTVFQSWAPAGYLSGSTPGFDIEFCGGPEGQLGPNIVTTNIPAGAASGWVHMKIPIDPTMANIDGVNGVVFHKWIHQQWGILNPVVARVWVDNVMLIGTEAPPPPPKMAMPTKPVPGLNVFASTKGNSYYDRQEAELMQSSGLSWVGQATAANPVTYSFTIVGYPNSANCEAYMFLVPNASYNTGAPDWNMTNCAICYLQGTATTATMHFQYKVNEDSQQAMYSGGTETRGSYINPPGSWDGVTTPWLETGNLASITNNGVLGTWTVKFTSDTNITLITPNGNTTNFVMPAYNAPYFAETTGFNIYLGMQANQADAMNQAVVYSRFSVSNTASPFSENFLEDTVLDTTNVWRTSVAGGPAGVLIVPPTAAYWVSWSLPDGGYSLEDAATLNNPLGWNSPTMGPAIGMSGARFQLIDRTEQPAGNQAFFRLVQRAFTKLQILFPGETNAPNTVTGKVGTPDVVSMGAGGLATFTVNAVDDTWHLVSGATDSISFTATDGGAVFNSTSVNLVNGTLQNTVLFSAESGATPYTITATDTTTNSILPVVSSPITVGP